MSSALFFAGEEKKLQDFIQQVQARQIVLLCDAKTHGFCLPILLQLIPEWQTSPRIVVPDGEVNKTLEIASLVWDQLSTMGANRHSLLVCIGGGMLCDLGGFAASVYKRGMDTLYIPTTLLAMVDAAHGGKTGLDFQGVKNNLGSFHPPKAVYLQPHFLHTLPERQIRSGIAEMIKHALLDSDEHWKQIQSFELTDFCTPAAIQRSINFKQSLVEQDEKDLHVRQALNFGHSIGHALESASLQTSQPLLHGEAIALGMHVELNLSMHYHQLDPAIEKQYKVLRQRIFPDLHYPLETNKLLSFLLQDKKNHDGLRMSLISKPGQAKIGTLVHTQNILEALQILC